MASVMEKLYPPIIGGSLPACYKDKSGTVVITVPFSMNRAVDSKLVGGFRIKIKTVQSNTFLKTLDIVGSDLIKTLNNNIAIFHWTDFDDSKVKLGQFLKIQMAYIGKEDDTVGYFSTVGIIKYTSKPNVYIEGISSNANHIEAFQQSYIGVFETGEDKSERPYSYCFYLYDKNKNIVETSGWIVHNTTINNIASESLSLDKTTDAYTFKSLINVDTEYYLQYGVRTINNLEIFSPLYTCLEPDIGPAEFYMNLKAENNFDNAFIELSLEMKSDEELLNLFNGDLIEIDEYTNKKLIYRENQEEPIATISIIAPENPVSIEICRAELTDNYKTWRTLQKVYFTDYFTALSWTFRDLTIEQGITYKYCYRQYNGAGIQSTRTYSDEVFADFEDMFLWDGKRQIRIRYNPKVSSFKTNHLEQKIDTIGNKYPFFFRNGIVEYKEFPIAGLISYLVDDDEMFLNHKEDLNIILGQNIYRKMGTPIDQSKYDTTINGKEKKSWEVSQTLDSLGYNIRAERVFKLKLLEWLGNGEIKMFKSATEGNYLVRLLNVSLTPEDKLGRMLHSFSATAYEIEKLTYENLINLNFISAVDQKETVLEIETVSLKQKVRELIDSSDVSIKINNNDIVNNLFLQHASGSFVSPGFWLRLGDDIKENASYIEPGFSIKTENSSLPDVWFNLEDNMDLIQNGKLESLIDLVGDTVLTYTYYRTSSVVGSLHDINNVYMCNDVETIIGPIQNRGFSSSTSTEEKEILKFFVVNFKRKQIREIAEENGIYRDLDTTSIIKQFDQLSLYKIDDQYYYVNDDGELITDENVGPDDVKIVLVDRNGFEYRFNEPPILDLNTKIYSSISMGSAVYLECAYQSKITIYKDEEE